jgi:hypothetical protein
MADPLQIFSILQYISDIIVVPCCMKSVSLPYSLVAENSCYQLSGRHLFKLFGSFGDCVSMHCFDCSLVSTYTNETQVSSPVTHTM